jgi:hypothetical protein
MSMLGGAAPSTGTVRMRRALVAASCGVLTVSLSACESTEQESAKIGREGQRLVASQGALQLGAVNHSVRVADVTLLTGAGRTAVAVRLTGTSTRPQLNVPVLVSVTGAHGRVLYSNDTGGLEASLQRVALLRPGQEEWWVNDQVLTSQTPAGVTVRVGTGAAPSATIPQVAVSGVSLGQQAGLPLLTGTIVDHSAHMESKVPVFAVAVRGGRVIAAGRAVAESLAPRTPTQFQIFFVGDPAGASIKGPAHGRVIERCPA